MKRADRPAVISLFSGALGLDLGLERAGFETRVAVECNRFAAETIRRNRPDIPVIERKIETVTTEEILKVARLRPGEAAMLAGGPSCQSFSTAGQRGSLGDPRGIMFREFLRVVREARPRFFVMENVCGVLSAAVRHRPLAKRGPGFRRLRPEEELGSAFVVVLRALKRTGYYTIFDVLDAAAYGVPQMRMRLVFIGSRDGEEVRFPGPTHSEVGNGLPEWVSLKVALKGLRDPKPEYNALSPKKLRYVRLVPEGGNWRDLPPRLRRGALGGAYKSWGGRNGFFRRLAWNSPAPALTTRPDSKATMFVHPEEDRPLSVREYARLQQFPDGWEFAGGAPQQYVQIGNAVPLGLAEAVGDALMKLFRQPASRRRIHLGRVVCLNPDLLSRLLKRGRTKLNPTRMRRIRSVQAAKNWLKARHAVREALGKLLTADGASNGTGREGAKTEA